jgi:hypothetical protein
MVLAAVRTDGSLQNPFGPSENITGAIIQADFT